jgi:hypothetical protein
MKYFAGLFVLLWLGTGCGVARFSGSTTIHYAVDEQGRIKTLDYENNKDIAGLDVEYEVDELGKVKKVKIQVDKATTSEAAIAAALQIGVENSKLLQQLLPVVKSAATHGATIR